LADKELQFDKIGYWSEVKLEIIKRYGVEYSKILTATTFDHLYIDAFAGGGHRIARSTNELVLGSPLNALAIKPPFKEIFLIDLEPAKTSRLRDVIGDRKDVHILEGDCNKLLLETVFPKVRYEKYRRALCVLDPYGLHLNWKVIETAGKSRAIEIFLNFPVADINRNVLWNDPARVSPEQAARLTTFWETNLGEMSHIRQKVSFSAIDTKSRSKLSQRRLAIDFGNSPGSSSSLSRFQCETAVARLFITYTLLHQIRPVTES